MEKFILCIWIIRTVEDQRGSSKSGGGQWAVRPPSIHAKSQYACLILCMYAFVVCEQKTILQRADSAQHWAVRCSSICCTSVWPTTSLFSYKHTVASVGDHCRSSTDLLWELKGRWSICHEVPPSRGSHTWMFFLQSPLTRRPVNKVQAQHFSSCFSHTHMQSTL